MDCLHYRLTYKYVYDINDVNHYIYQYIDYIN